MTASVEYVGTLRCRATHTRSGTVIETDAPTDNRGKGEKFSPTDLLCVSLATCILTTMGIKAQDLDVTIAAATAAVTKHMLADPRRVGAIDVAIRLTATADDKQRIILQRTGDHCPVMKSIHPDIEARVTYEWG